MVAVPDRPIEIPLRQKNQLTLPASVAAAMEAAPGDRLLIEINPAQPGVATLRRLRDSYFGVAKGAYGDTDAILRYVRGEQDDWGD